MLRVNTPTDVPAAVASAIRSMRAPIVIAHVRPDADALGSAFAMALAWREPGRTPRVALPDGSLSQRLRFMAEWADVPLAAPEHFPAADGFVVVDTARHGRCNVGESLRARDWSAGRPVVNVDHHETNENFGSVNWIVADASSTAELVYHHLRAAGRTITPLIASLLYAGIHSDTVGFSLPTTSASSLHAAAELVGLGADVATIGERLCRSQSPAEFELVRLVYANTRVLEGGRLTYSTASYDEIRRSRCEASDIDDQIAIPRSLDGAVLSMLFTEGIPGKTRINFRSEGAVTVVELAQEFGGGGHARAAGAVVDAGLQETVARVLPRASAHLAKFS